jgi:O-antigen ligase
MMVLFSFKNRPAIFASMLVLLAGIFLTVVSFLISSGMVSEALSRDGLSFQRYPKAYVNSINSRVVLWKASFRLLAEDGNWMAGFSSEKLEPALDAQVGELNGYLKTRHLNPHNQFLYLLIHYGLAGLIVFLFFWYRIFAITRKNSALFGMWLFAFLCSQTEIYLDREFGSQLYLLLVLISIWAEQDLRTKSNPVHAV